MNKVYLSDGTYVHANVERNGSGATAYVDNEYTKVEQIGNEWFATEFADQIREWGANYYYLQGEPMQTVRILKLEYVDDDDEWESELSVSSLNNYPVVRFFIDDVYGLLLA